MPVIHFLYFVETAITNQLIKSIVSQTKRRKKENNRNSTVITTNLAHP